jgi:hypothetical protein
MISSSSCAKRSDAAVVVDEDTILTYKLDHPIGTPHFFIIWLLRDYDALGLEHFRQSLPWPGPRSGV